MRSAVQSIEHLHLDTPSDWVVRFAPLAQSGAVLDVACGSGRHARLFASRGHAVDAVDRNVNALSVLAGIPGITTCCADLEGGSWPYPGRRYSLVIVANYLHRPLFPQLFAAVDDGGVLIYETFMQGNERLGRPSNPDFLLRPGELLHAIGSSLSIVAFEQGIVARPKRAAVQRVCAVRGDISQLDLPDPLNLR